MDNFFQATKADKNHPLKPIHNLFTPDIMESQLRPMHLRTSILLAGPLNINGKKYKTYNRDREEEEGEELENAQNDHDE